MLETIVGSSVVAALVTAIVGGVFKLIDRKREDAVRREERNEAREDRAADAELQDRRERARKEAERPEKRKAEGRGQGLILLQCLEALEAHFDSEGMRGSYQTYTYKRELCSPIIAAIRRMPEAEFREYATLALQVINEIWVPASAGEGPEEPAGEQRRILQSLIAQVGRYITDDGGIARRQTNFAAPRMRSTNSGRRIIASWRFAVTP